MLCLLVALAVAFPTNSLVEELDNDVESGAKSSGPPLERIRRHWGGSQNNWSGSQNNWGGWGGLPNNWGGWGGNGGGYLGFSGWGGFGNGNRFGQGYGSAYGGWW